MDVCVCLPPLDCELLIAAPGLAHSHLLPVQERQAPHTVAVECWVWWGSHPFTGTHSSLAVKPLGKNTKVIKWGSHLKDTPAV